MVCMPSVHIQQHTLAYARPGAQMQKCIHKGMLQATCILDGMHAACAYAASYAGICKTQGPNAAVHTQGNASSNLHAGWYACRACYADSHAGICKTRGPYAAVHTRGNAGPTCTLDCTHGERAYADSYAGICKTRGPYAAVHTRGNAGPTCTLDCTHGERAYAASYAGICKTQGPNAAVHTPGNPESNLHTNWYACRVCICSFIRWHMQDPGPICSSANTRESQKQPAY
jgi:hypothetical protein